MDPARLCLRWDTEMNTEAKRFIVECRSARGNVNARPATALRHWAGPGRSCSARPWRTHCSFSGLPIIIYSYSSFFLKSDFIDFSCFGMFCPLPSILRIWSEFVCSPKSNYNLYYMHTLVPLKAVINFGWNRKKSLGTPNQNCLLSFLNKKY